MALLTKEESGKFASLVLGKDERALKIYRRILKRTVEIIVETDPDRCNAITRGIVDDIRQVIQ